MNILVTTNQLDLGGAEHFVVRLANGLHARGHRVWVAAEHGPLASLLVPGVGCLSVPARSKSPRGIWKLSRHFARLIAEHRIDIVHANSPTTALAARIARGPGGPAVLTTAHGSWRPWTKPAVALLFSLGSDRVMGCSEALTSDLIRHGLSRRKALTVHNGIPFRDEAPDPGVRLEVRRELGIDPTDPVLLVAARLSEEKGLTYLLEAMPLLWRERPEAWLLIAGDGPQARILQERAEALGGRIRMLGMRSDVPRLMAAADVFCLPSLVEGLPLALAEAMGHGLPAVASRVGGVPELIREGETGLLVPPRDPEQLAQKLLLLLGDPALRQQVGSAGRALVRREFTLDRMIGRFEAVYQSFALLNPLPAR